MTTKPFALQECRLRFPGSTYTDQFTALNDATWIAAGGSPATFKAHVVNGPVPVEDLKTPRLPNPCTRTRGRGLGRGIVGKQEGTIPITFFMNSSQAQDDMLLLLEYIFGGRYTPGINSFEVEGTSTTTAIEDLGLVAAMGGDPDGAALLCGLRGDGRGNGEVIPIASSDTNILTLSRATKTAMTAALPDKCWCSHTVYPDMDATINYFEVALIGDDSTSPDQYNLIGCQATEVTIGQINLEDGEMPVITIQVAPGRYRQEPAATKATISHAVPSGAGPVALGIGGFWITNSGSAQVRGYLDGGQFGVTPGIRWVPFQSPQHYNNIGGWRRAPGAATWTAVMYGDEGSPDSPIPEHNADFASDTHEHQVMMQFGHAADKCCAVALDVSYLDREPFRTELNEMVAYGYEGHADENGVLSDLQAGDVKLHFFHIDAP